MPSLVKILKEDFKGDRSKITLTRLNQLKKSGRITDAQRKTLMKTKMAYSKKIAADKKKRDARIKAAPKPKVDKDLLQGVMGIMSEVGKEKFVEKGGPEKRLKYINQMKGAKVRQALSLWAGHTGGSFNPEAYVGVRKKTFQVVPARKDLSQTEITLKMLQVATLTPRALLLGIKKSLDAKKYTAESTEKVLTWLKNDESRILPYVGKHWNKHLSQGKYFTIPKPSKKRFIASASQKQMLKDEWEGYWYDNIAHDIIGSGEYRELPNGIINRFFKSEEDVKNYKKTFQNIYWDIYGGHFASYGYKQKWK
jgi:hypothetical protein